LNNTLEKQQGKETPANAIATQDLKDRKNHSLLTTDLATAEKRLAWGTPQATQTCNPSPPK